MTPASPAFQLQPRQLPAGLSGSLACLSSFLSIPFDFSTVQVSTVSALDNTVAPRLRCCLPLPHPSDASALDPRVTFRKYSCPVQIPSVAPGHCTEDTRVQPASRTFLPEEWRLKVFKAFVQSP